VKEMANHAKFSKSQVKLVKSLVSQFGLAGAVVVFAEQGVKVSIPTLKKYASSGLGGRPPVKLKRGRRKKAV
jgi:hypothetical protein